MEIHRGLFKRWLLAGAMAVAVSACSGSVANGPINEPIAHAGDQGNSARISSERPSSAWPSPAAA
jgi:hypothetical protein